MRRINWGWAILMLHSGAAGPYPQSLPREVTFNPVARQLEQPPIEELKQLRGPAAYAKTVKVAAGSFALGLENGVARQSEFVASIELPEKAATFGFTIGAPGGEEAGMLVSRSMDGYAMSGWGSYGRHNASAASVCEATCDADSKCNFWSFMATGPTGPQCLYNSNSVHRQCPFAVPNSTLGFKNETRLPGCVSNTSHLQCSIEFTPPTNASAAFYEVPVSCGGTRDTLRLLPSEKAVEIRVFSDHSFIEAFFQRGRVAMTVPTISPDEGRLRQYLSPTADMGFVSTVDIVTNVSVFPMEQIWVNPDEVRDQNRVFPPGHGKAI